ncbi:MAG TPA: hypothetical protein VFS54_11145 [Solirubrobacterales bacterium]|nr:hypothetical protein [Solirubrobacterales bacterium]
MGLVAEPVASLLGRRSVVAQPIGLDHQAQVRPVEVDFEFVHPLAGERHRQAGLGGQRHKAPFQFLLGEPKSPPVEDLAEPGNARLTGPRVESAANPGRVGKVVFVSLVDHPLDIGAVEPKRHVDQGLDGRGDRDAELASHITVEVE